MAVTKGQPSGFWPACAAYLFPMLAAVMAGMRSSDTSPWGIAPITADFRVYVVAARVLLEGGDFYAPVPGVFPYIYPPLAALLATPFTLVPWVAAQTIWLALQGALVVLVLRRLGLSLTAAGMAGVAVILLLAPFGSVMELGQVGVLLLALVVLDLIRPAEDRRRRLPAGIGLGVATGIKLTPAVFIIHLWLIGRRRDAVVASGTFLATVALGLAVAPTRAWGYWWRLAMGDSGANMDSSGWLFNLSVVSATQRFLGLETGKSVGLMLALILLVVGLAAAALAHRRGQSLLALGVLGLTSSLANPIAWIHHLVWVLLLIAALLPAAFTTDSSGKHADGPTSEDLPSPMRWLVLLVTIWMCTQPQLTIGGAPHAVEEIHGYTAWEKTLAAMPDILVAVLAVSVLVWCLQMQRDATRTRPMESDVS